MANSSVGAATPSPSTIRKVLLASCAASSIEWYDFFIYLTAAALVFPKLFFPADIDPVAGVLASFSTAAVGFVARPVGGVLFGHFGDRLGRKTTLVTALVLMGIATTLVGVLPSYAQIGIWAAVALFVLRICQGLAVGGQWGGAVLLATEYAPPNRRGFYGSFAQMGVPVGLVLGNAFFLVLSATLSSEQFGAWGWRIPFLASIILIGLAMYIQLRLEDTPAFRRLQETAQQTQQEDSGSRQRSPIMEVLREHPKQVLLAAGAFFVINGSFYIMITGILDYGTRDLGLSRSSMLTAVLISSIFQIAMLPAFSILSDRVGRRPVYLVGAVLLGLWAFPMFWLIDTKSIVLIAGSLVIGQAFLSMMYGPQAALFSEMFSRRVRYSGASLGYQLASVFAGGLAPIIMVSLLDWTGTSLSVSFYMLAMAALTFVSVYLVTETYEDQMAEDVAEEEGALTGGRDAVTS
ncbi:MAG: MHS family MFS transporter [Actinomycetota bacterium]|nr:MHS family MFS transporter [Actinomycetota bacterium]